MPGLIDAHVHIANLRSLRTALESGVTTARSSGVSHYVDVGMRELVKQGFVSVLTSSRRAITCGRRSRRRRFSIIPSQASLMRGVTTVDALRRMVQANLSRGVEWIKVLATERAGTPEH